WCKRRFQRTDNPCIFRVWKPRRFASGGGFFFSVDLERLIGTGGTEQQTSAPGAFFGVGVSVALRARKRRKSTFSLAASAWRGNIANLGIHAHPSRLMERAGKCQDRSITGPGSSARRRRRMRIGRLQRLEPEGTCAAA